jgi:hypothetical protein
VAWLNLDFLRLKKTGERSNGYVSTATDHYVFKLANVDKVTNFPFRYPDAGGELLRCFHPLI